MFSSGKKVGAPSANEHVKLRSAALTGENTTNLAVGPQMKSVAKVSLLRGVDL